MDIAIDITKTEIETERLLLRYWRETDINDLYEYASVEGVGEMAGWPRHESAGVSREVLQSFMSEKNCFAIVYKENGKVIGSFGLHTSWANDDSAYTNLKVKELGYALSKDYWGRGLAPEAARAVIDFCFGELGLDALTCGHFISNRQSKRVIEKCGFRFVKSGKYYSRQLRVTYDDMKYILLKAEYRGQICGGF
jgi:ribosomal-protein-alanine N-acetyltransferase